MKRPTVLKLHKIKNEKFMYQAYPIWEEARKIQSINGFLDGGFDIFFTENNSLPAILAKHGMDGYYLLIEFYKRVNHQLFGKNIESGKCIYGVFSHPWHKKTNIAELTLFESEVDFEDLYHFDFDEGKYVPEFSTKQNWIMAYHAADPKNVRTSLDFVMSQPKSPQLLHLLDVLKEKGFVSNE